MFNKLAMIVPVITESHSLIFWSCQSNKSMLIRDHLELEECICPVLMKFYWSGSSFWRSFSFHASKTATTSFVSQSRSWSFPERRGWLWLRPFFGRCCCLLSFSPGKKISIYSYMLEYVLFYSDGCFIGFGVDFGNIEDKSLTEIRYWERLGTALFFSETSLRFMRGFFILAFFIFFLTYYIVVIYLELRLMI